MRFTVNHVARNNLYVFIVKFLPSGNAFVCTEHFFCCSVRDPPPPPSESVRVIINTHIYNEHTSKATHWNRNTQNNIYCERTEYLNVICLSIPITPNYLHCIDRPQRKRKTRQPTKWLNGTTQRRKHDVEEEIDKAIIFIL